MLKAYTARLEDGGRHAELISRGRKIPRHVQGIDRDFDSIVRRC